MKNKRRLIVLIIITVVTAILIGLIIFGVVRKDMDSDTKQTDDALPDNIVEETVDTNITANTVPPISQDTSEKETVTEKADVELDIGKIERDTDPELIDTKIEYGTKEGKEDEQKNCCNNSLHRSCVGNCSGRRSYVHTKRRKNTR